VQCVRFKAFFRCRGICSAAILVLAASACQSTITPVVSLPASLVAPMPMSVGIFYDEAFRNHKIQNDTPKYSNLVSDTDILTGRASVEFFDRIFSDMFETTVSIKEKSEAFEGREHLDAIVQPALLHMGTYWNEDGMTMIESVSVRYSVAIHDTGGAQIRSWTVQGDGRTSQMTGLSSLEDAAALAMRDAGARLMVAIYSDPNIKKCLDSDSDASRRGEGFLRCIAEQ
jgi:hypothetical protein